MFESTNILLLCLCLVGVRVCIPMNGIRKLPVTVLFDLITNFCNVKASQATTTKRRNEQLILNPELIHVNTEIDMPVVNFLLSLLGNYFNFS